MMMDGICFMLCGEFMGSSFGPDAALRNLAAQEVAAKPLKNLSPLASFIQKTFFFSRFHCAC